MYRRYEPRRNAAPNVNKPPPAAEPNRNPSGNRKSNQSKNAHNNPIKEKADAKKETNAAEQNLPQKKSDHPLMKFIPKSLYNPETGKVLGIMSADDLLIIALILIMLDGGDDCEDNSMLIYALIYILLSEYIELPF